MDVTITITGTTPLLMHNGQLADKLNPWTKQRAQVTSKKKKTDDDEMEVRRLEFLGSLYTADGIGPYVPGENIARALRDAATITKQGRDVVRGLFVTTDVCPLAYRGPRDPDALWADENFRNVAPVKQQMSRIIRCRPQFREWRVAADAILDTNVLDLEDLKRITDTAGTMVGLGDWRPRYGRFTATVDPA